MARKNNEYFDGFVELVEYSCKAAEYLHTALQNFNPDEQAMTKQMEELHAIEHEADMKKHDLMSKLVKEFVTPIEREDIIQLTNEIDNVTDKIEDVLLRVYMYNVQEIREEALLFTGLISRCCKALKVAMEELHNFHKSEKLHQAIINVNTLEEEGDDLYLKAMRRLFTEGADPVTTHSWSEMFDRLEDCCDTCEEVAGVMETVVMKNS